MRICLICPEYPSGPHGGIGSYTQATARELIKLGHQVRVIGVYKKTYPAPDRETDHGVEVFRLRERTGKFGWVPAWVEQFRTIRRWAKGGEIDIVEAPDSRGWYAFWLKLPIPVVLRFHGSQTYIAHLTRKKPNRLTNCLEALAYKRADALSSVSNFNATTTAQLFGIKRDVTVIYNGLEPYSLTNLKRMPKKIVFAGTLNTFKGIVDFMNALLLLAQENVNFKACVYGKDAVLDDGRIASHFIRELSETSLLKGKLDYYGSISREELMSIYETATVAVFPSHVESFGLAPIEAMMCECPVIFTNNTTGPEIMEDGVDGILVAPWQPGEIKDAIQTILNNQELATELGMNGRKNVLRKFSLQRQVLRNLDFYAKAIRKKQKLNI
jgi:glycogen synthase